MSAPLIPFLAAFTATALPAQDAPAIVITRVAIVDARSPRPERERTIVIRGDRIVAIVPSSGAALPAGARIIDGRGLFAIPGLWDMHVHLDVPRGRDLLGLYVANGVTGVRDMAGHWNTLRTWRRDIAAGFLPGPRIVAAGPYLEGGDTPVPHLLTRTPEEGIAGVDSLGALGVDFVKVHGRLRKCPRCPREELFSRTRSITRARTHNTHSPSLSPTRSAARRIPA